MILLIIQIWQDLINKNTPLNFLMSVPIGALREHLAAELAWIWFLPGVAPKVNYHASQLLTAVATSFTYQVLP